MTITQLLTFERIAWNRSIPSKTAVIHLISQLFANDGPPPLLASAVYSCLQMREAISNTAMGHGIAIPHGRLAEQTTIQGAFVKLATPIEFGASDQQPVDLLFALLIPAEYEHLYLLSRLGTLFKDSRLCAQLRQADHATTVMTLLKTWENS